jgi:D-aminopeptidase
VVVEFNSPGAAEVLCYTPLAERIDTNSVKAVFASMADAMRFVAFAAMYSPTGRLEVPD